MSLLLEIDRLFVDGVEGLDGAVAETFRRELEGELARRLGAARAAGATPAATEIEGHVGAAVGTALAVALAGAPSRPQGGGDHHG